MDGTLRLRYHHQRLGRQQGYFWWNRYTKDVIQHNHSTAKVMSEVIVQPRQTSGLTHLFRESGRICLLYPVLASAQQTFPPGGAIPLSSNVTSTVETGAEVQPEHKGFLSCADSSLPATFRHGLTQQLFDNVLLPSITTRQIIVGGHGAPGVLCTGDGDQCAKLSNTRTTLED